MPIPSLDFATLGRETRGRIIKTSLVGFALARCLDPGSLGGPTSNSSYSQDEADVSNLNARGNLVRKDRRGGDAFLVGHRNKALALASFRERSLSMPGFDADMQGGL